MKWVHVLVGSSVIAACLPSEGSLGRWLEAAALSARAADGLCADRALRDGDLHRAEACAEAYRQARSALRDAESLGDSRGGWCTARRAAQHVRALWDHAGTGPVDATGVNLDAPVARCQ